MGQTETLCIAIPPAELLLLLMQREVAESEAKGGPSRSGALSPTVAL